MLAGAVAVTGFHTEQSILSWSLGYTRIFSILISIHTCTLLHSSGDCGQLHKCSPGLCPGHFAGLSPAPSSQKCSLPGRPQLEKLPSMTLLFMEGSFAGPAWGQPVDWLTRSYKFYFLMTPTCWLFKRREMKRGIKGEVLKSISHQIFWSPVFLRNSWPSCFRHVLVSNWFWGPWWGRCVSSLGGVSTEDCPDIIQIKYDQNCSSPDKEFPNENIYFRFCGDHNQ